MGPEDAAIMSARMTAAFVLAVLSTVAAVALAATHRVTVGADGSFSPAVLHIRAGDTVEWGLLGRTSAIVAATGAPPAPNVCPVPRPFAAGDPENFTGPMPFAPSGVFSLGPLGDRGMRLQNTPCQGGRSSSPIDGRFLCASGPAFTTMEETWADASNVGVFIRLLWNRLQPRPGTADTSFDFTDLDREIDQAVRHGKISATRSFRMVFRA